MPRVRKPKIKNYGLDFKLRAVQLSHQRGVLVKDVADSLGIHPFSFWKRSTGNAASEKGSRRGCWWRRKSTRGAGRSWNIYESGAEGGW
jgi:transposase-like protein